MHVLLDDWQALSASGQFPCSSLWTLRESFQWDYSSYSLVWENGVERGSKIYAGNSSASLKTSVASELRRLLIEPGLEELMHMPDFRLAGRLLLLVLGKKHGETLYLGFFDHENKATNTCQIVWWWGWNEAPGGKVPSVVPEVELRLNKGSFPPSLFPSFLPLPPFIPSFPPLCFPAIKMRS